MFVFGSSRDESYIFLQKIEFILFLTISGVSLIYQFKLKKFDLTVLQFINHVQGFSRIAGASKRVTTP